MDKKGKKMLVGEKKIRINDDGKFEVEELKVNDKGQKV